MQPSGSTKHVNFDHSLVSRVMTPDAVLILIQLEGRHHGVLELYTGCNRKNVRDFGRVFLMLKYTDITQNTYIQS